MFQSGYRLVAVCLLVFCAGLACAQDAKLPSWLSLGAEYRFRLDTFVSSGLRDRGDDTFAVGRFRLTTEFIPFSWARVLFQVQDARVFWRDLGPAVPPYHDGVDLRQAYLQLGDAEKHPFSFRVGRQALRFGERRLITDSTWRNVSRSYDALRATIKHGDFRVDAFAASVPEVRPGAWNNRRVDGNNIHGVYGVWSDARRGLTLDVYGFWRLNPSATTENGARAKLDTKTTGFRWAAKLASGFEFDAESAFQRGRRGPESVSAWAGHWTAGRRFEDRKGKPFVYVDYNFASGDKAPGDGRAGTFDPLYGSTHERYGLVDLFCWRNIRHLRGSLEIEPSHRLLIHVSQSHYWLASSRDGWYASGGAYYARQMDGSAGSFVGRAADVHADWALSRWVQVGAGYARLLPGSFVKRAAPGASHNYIFLYFSGRF